jgi:hypothetical protein
LWCVWVSGFVDFCFPTHRSHSVSFTRAQGIPTRLGLGEGKDGRVGAYWLRGGGGSYLAWPLFLAKMPYAEYGVPAGCALTFPCPPGVTHTLQIPLGIVKGDVDKALAGSAHVISGTLGLGGQKHMWVAYLPVHVCSHTPLPLTRTHAPCNAAPLPRSLPCTPIAAPPPTPSLQRTWTSLFHPACVCGVPPGNLPPRWLRLECRASGTWSARMPSPGWLTGTSLRSRLQPRARGCAKRPPWR